jgi:hypothetical protein
MTQILAWRGDPALKAEAVALMTAHRAADDFIQGTFTQLGESSFRGCFHGCLTTEKLAAEANLPVTDYLRHSSAAQIDYYGEGERIWGIDRKVGYVLDRTFEAMPDGEHGDFAVAATQAIPVGADLSRVIDRWLLDILADPEMGVRRHTADGSAQWIAVDAVIALYERRLAGDEPTRDEWIAARRAAAAAYASAYAAYASAYAAYASAYAAYASAYAAYASASAAYAADASASASSSAYAADAYASARSVAHRWQAGRLLHHLSAAPQPARAE